MVLGRAGTGRGEHGGYVRGVFQVVVVVVVAGGREGTGRGGVEMVVAVLVLVLTVGVLVYCLR